MHKVQERKAAARAIATQWSQQHGQLPQTEERMTTIDMAELGLSWLAAGAALCILVLAQ